MARRLNTRFLTILLLVVVGVVGGLFILVKLRREHPDRYIEAGKQALKDHKYQDAAANFARAARLDQHDPAIPMYLAEAYAGLVQSDPVAARGQIASYQQALEIDPKYLPALRALSDFFTKAAASGPVAGNFDSAIDYTHRAHQVAPDDDKLEARYDQLVIESWSNRLSTDKKPVDDAIKELKELWKKNTSDADLPYAIAAAEIAEGITLTTQDPDSARLPKVTDHFKNAISTFESVLTGPNGGSQAQNASIHYAFARTLQHLSTVDQMGSDTVKQYQDRAAKEADTASKLSKATDPDYIDINEYDANLIMQHGDRAGAIAIYKRMLQTPTPQTPLIQISLADVLSRSPDSQADAVTLLKSVLASMPDDASHIALGGIRFFAMMELAKVQIYQYLEMANGPAREKAHDEIRASLDKLNQTAGVRTIPALADIEARFEIGSGTEEEMAEVQKLSKMMANNPPSTKDFYWYSLEILLAQGYQDTNQASNAMAILKNVVQQYPHDVEARKRLINVLLIEQPDQVAPHIQELEHLSPNDPALNIYKIQLLLSDPVGNHDKIVKFYSLLKEINIPMMSAKARVALRIKEYDDAARLLTATTKQDPSRVDDWVMLARLKFMLDKKDEAITIANEGLAANPKDPHLRLLIPLIKGEDASVIRDLQTDLAKQNPDKSEGELTLASLAAQRGDPDEEETHLLAAVKASPDSTRVNELLFNFYLQRKQYDKAAKCIPMLAKTDGDRAGGQLYRLALAEAQNDTATAESIARKLTQDKPEFARSWLAMGDVLQNEGHYEQAIPQYNNCLEKESNLAEGYIGLARCYYGLHHNDAAMQTIEDGLKRLPGNPVLTEMKLAHELNYGQPDVAIKEIRAELDLHQTPQLYAALADADLRYCELLLKNKQPDDAAKQADQAVNVLKEPLTRWPDEESLYLAMSQSQLAARHPEETIKTLETWADRPNWKMRPEPYLAMSEIYERLGLPDKSEDEMHTAMARSGYRLDLQIRMASLLSMHKKPDDALGLLRSVNADKPEIQEKIVQVLLVAGKFDDAQAELKADLAKNPPNAETLLTTWSLAMFEHGQFNDAADRATQALAINPRNQTALFCRARSHLRAIPPDPRSAQQDLSLIRQTAPNNIEVRLCLADADLMLNQADAAIGELQAGIRALPDNKELRMRLVSLYANGPHPRLVDALKLLQDVETTPPFDKDSEIFQNEAVILSRQGNKNDALAKAEIARQLAPDKAEILRTEMQLMMDVQNYQAVLDHYAAMNDKLKATSWALWDLALAEKKMDNPQALPDFNRAMLAAKQEDQPAVLDSLARIVAKEFGNDEAIKDLIPISKDYPSAQITLARLYQMQGDDTSALATIDTIMSNFDKMSKRDQVNSLSNAALMYQLAKPVPMVDKAYEAYQRWIKLEPDNIEALNNMACLLADNYSPPRASEGLQFATQAVDEMSRLGRTEPRLLDTQAWLMILNGSPEDGVDILNKAMDSFDPFPEEYLHLGEGYLRKSIPNPTQALTQAKLGLQIISRRNGGDQDASLRAKLQDLINRSEEMQRNKPQAQVP